jgi:hypothetical protein
VIITKCLCGADPIVEQKPFISDYGNDVILYKYKCPNCKEKELPWMRQGDGWGALQIWNDIAGKRSYHKRTLEYNEHGVCISPPFKTLEWVNEKKTYEKVTVNFYLDNSMYYYCYDYWYKNGGCCTGLWIGDPCFPSFETASKAAMKDLTDGNKELKEIAEELLSPIPVQGELF